MNQQQLSSNTKPFSQTIRLRNKWLRVRVTLQPLKKVKIVILCRNLQLRLIPIGKTPWCYTYFFFSNKYFRKICKVLGKFGRENQISHFELKFATNTTSNMYNSAVTFTFSVLDWENPI